jgi:hypothetical protein
VAGYGVAGGHHVSLTSGDDDFDLPRVLMKSSVCRAGFAAWACMDCYNEYQREARRGLRRQEVREVEP